MTSCDERRDRSDRHTGRMAVAMRRSATTEYVWPELLRPADVRLVYLDLNHWVSLAKASVGHSEGRRHVAALEALRAFRAAGDVFPMCATHFMEVAGIK